MFRKHAILMLGLFAFGANVRWATAAAVPVTTYHNDNSRAGVNNAETILNTSNVNTNSFGKLYSLPVDGQIWAQPLYVPSVAIPGAGTHNVLYVATMHNSVYAFDADSGSGTPLWFLNLGPSVPCTGYYGNFCYGAAQPVPPETGIFSTPVIDPSTNAIYVVAETAIAGTNGTETQFSLHSLNLLTGQENANSPVVISGSVPGTGYGSSGGVLPFVPNFHLQHTGLTLLRGTIYFGFATGSDDQPPFHGWLFGYNETTLAQTLIKCFSPNHYGNGVWQGGAAFSSDNSSNLYIQTGNGSFTASTGGTEWGEALLKFNTVTSAITSYFVPYNEITLDVYDWDLGAGGTIILPSASPLIAPMIVAGGKTGEVFLLNTANLKGYNATDNVVQEFQSLTSSSPNGTSGHFGDSVFYNNALYSWGSGDVLKRWAFSGTSFSLSGSGPVQAFPFAACAPSMSVSSNGLTSGTGILWTVDSDSYCSGGAWYTGTLRAFSTANVSTELWDSNLRGSLDAAGNWSKFIPPTIVNGKVYLATLDGEVNVFGLLP